MRSTLKALRGTPRSSSLRHTALLCCLALRWATTAPAADWLVGKPFETALEKTVGRAWGGQDGNSLRDVQRQLAESYRLAILLDRRVDPTQTVNLTLPPTSLREMIAALAHSVDCQSSVVGNVVYVGPSDFAKKLQTLIELRNAEFAKLTSGTAGAKSPWRHRSVSLTQRKSFVWQDLDQPRELLKMIADRFQIEVLGLDRVPHDLWAACALPQVTATEALSLMLVQFGSTFEFETDRAAVRIVPIPSRVVIERTHVVPANSAVTLAAIREQFADVELEQHGTKLIVRGSVEQQAEIAAWFKPGGSKPAQKTAGKPMKPLAERRFSLKQENVPLEEVIKTFVAFGVPITFDRSEFAAANISLETKVDINVDNVPAEKLFRELFEPRGVDVTIEGNAVHLRPKPR